MLVKGPRLIPRFKAFAGERLLRALRADGVDVRLGSNATRVDREGPDGSSPSLLPMVRNW